MEFEARVGILVGTILVGCIHDHKRDKIFIVLITSRLELGVWVRECNVTFGFPRME
jgi:hypothetical protein